MEENVFGEAYSPRTGLSTCSVLPLGRVLLEPSIPGTWVCRERAKADSKPSCRLTTMLILIALQHAGLHQGLWVPRPVAGVHTTKGQKLQGKRYTHLLRDVSIPQ